MAAFKHLLSQTGCRGFSNSPLPRHLLPVFRRWFSTDPQPSPPNPEPSTQPNANVRQPIPLQPVSYPIRPKAPVSEEIEQESPPERRTSSVNSVDSIKAEARSWTRDEMRYLKDATSISPVSYPVRTAPLPEDIPQEEVEQKIRNEELERERRKIEEDRRGAALRYAVREEYDENLPFAKLIKLENTEQSSKKKAKVIYDLKEAIRLVKLVDAGVAV